MYVRYLCHPKLLTNAFLYCNGEQSLAGLFGFINFLL